MNLARISVGSQGYKQNHREDHVVNIPLKNFVRCDVCDTNWTGYLVKKKGLYYYKCNRRGCACNQSAKKMHVFFQELLKEYTLTPNLGGLLKGALENQIEYLSTDQREERERYEVEKKIERVEERFVLEKITHKMYEKYMPKYRKEKDQIMGQLQNSLYDLSNLYQELENIVEITTNSLEIW